MKSSSFRFVLAAVLVVIVSGSAVAQTFMFKSVPGERPKIGLRYLRPSFKNDVDLSTFSGIYDLRMNLPINNKWSIDATFPLTRYAVGDEDSESFIGNVYAGMQYLSRTGNATGTVSFGAYLPTADDDLSNLFFGMFTNFEDFFKYYPDALTLYGNYSYINVSDGGLRLGLEIGPDLLVPTGEGDDDVDFLVHYGLTAGYRGERFAALSELIGVAWVTGDWDDFGDRFLHSIDFGVSYVSPRFMPGVFYKIYLKDEFSDIVDGVLGVDIEVTL
jgi:hypothetical protein